MFMKKFTMLWLALTAGTVFAATFTDAEKKEISTKFNPSVEEIKQVVPQDFFPVIMFYGDGCMLRNSASILNDTWGGRREKLYHQLARWYINTVIPSNSRLSPADYAMAQNYGLKVIHFNNMLYIVPNNELISGVSDKMDDVKKSWAAEVDKVKNLPNLLAYQVYDEPHPEVCTSIALMSDYVRSLDKKPVLFTTQNMPVGGSRAEWTALAKCHVILSDQYNVSQAFGRNPWSYRESIAEFSKPNKNAYHWPIVQAFSYNMDPTPADFRIMVFNALAAGAKGLGLYISGSTNFSWPAPKGSSYPALGSIVFSEDIFSIEVGRIARLLSTAGEFLVPRTYTADYKYSTGKNEKINTAKYIGEKNPNYAKGKLRPAIEVAAFTGKDLDILVIHNNDPNLCRSDVVKLPAADDRKILVDLRSLLPVPAKDGGFYVEFDKGDGSLFAYGTTETIAPVIEKIQRNRFTADARLLRLKMAVAERYSVDITDAETILDEAANAPAAEMEKKLQEATAAFYAAEADTPEYMTMMTAFESARNAYGEIDRRLRRIPVHYTTPMDKLPAKVQKHIKDAVDFAIKFTEVENLYISGKCTPAIANELMQKCRLILAEDFAL